MLSLFNTTDENIIIAARLPHDTKLKPIELLRREKVSLKTTTIFYEILERFQKFSFMKIYDKCIIFCNVMNKVNYVNVFVVLYVVKDECTWILKTISHRINSEHHELQSHRLLSIFKMAEVEVVWPESSDAINHHHLQPFQHCLIVASLLSAMLLSMLLECYTWSDVRWRWRQPVAHLHLRQWYHQRTLSLTQHYT